MNIYVVIPVHNEEDCISLMLESLVKQKLLPKKVVIVNDDSSDGTEGIILEFSNKYDWISSINITSSKKHIPGSKVIRAFNKGYEILDDDYDIICKFDADIILPDNYLESIVDLFNSDEKIGIAGGLAYIKKNGSWVYETVSSKEHVRGPFKAYRKACFTDIGGLKESIGWDTADVLLARYYNWKVVTNQSLKVKHLKPTGRHYSKKSKYLQGEALYKLRYGLALTCIASLKSAWNKRSFSYFRNCIKGYLKSKRNNLQYLVSEKQGEFIRKFRWKGILNRLF